MLFYLSSYKREIKQYFRLSDQNLKIYTLQAFYFLINRYYFIAILHLYQIRQATLRIL